MLKTEETEEDSHVLLGHAHLCWNGDVRGVNVKIVAGAIHCNFDGWFHGLGRRMHGHRTHLGRFPWYVRSGCPKTEDPIAIAKHKTPFAVLTPHARST